VVYDRAKVRAGERFSSAENQERDMPHFLNQAIILIEDSLPILCSNRAVISMVRVLAMSAAKVARVGDV
jgi:hypothetical protein